MRDIKYYIQRVDISNQNAVSLEDDFTNIRFLEISGLNSVGASKAIYTESYAESDRLRVYIPSDGENTHEATSITLKLLIFGNEKERNMSYREFVNYITNGIHSYWDTKNEIKFDFVVKDEIVVVEEDYSNIPPYMIIEIKLQNLNGKSEFIG